MSKSTVFYLFHKDQIVLTPTNSLPTKDFILANMSCPNLTREILSSSSNTVMLSTEQIIFLGTALILTPLRQGLTYCDQKEQALICRAKSLINWEQHTQFCGCCGQKMKGHPTEVARVCSNCNKVSYPKLSPCAIFLIYSENKILLGRQPQWAPGLYSCLAGFIEPGETAEMTVHREALEEVNVRVTNLRYFHSQAWPFPDNLMIGFLAQYQSGELKIDETELEDAKLFYIHELPIVLPTASSLSRQMIEHYIKYPNLD